MCQLPAGGVRQADLEDLSELNRRRAEGVSPAPTELEARFARRYSADRHLAVYGSLGPGRANHGQLRELHGTWQSGLAVTGQLVGAGWGNDLGYPALRWIAGGPPVAIQLFCALELPRHWSRLDRFEGPDYVRMLVPVLGRSGVVALANLYALRP